MILSIFRLQRLLWHEFFSRAAVLLVTLFVSGNLHGQESSREREAFADFYLPKSEERAKAYNSIHGQLIDFDPREHFAIPMDYQRQDNSALVKVYPGFSVANSDKAASLLSADPWASEWEECHLWNDSYFAVLKPGIDGKPVISERRDIVLRDGKVVPRIDILAVPIASLSYRRTFVEMAADDTIEFQDFRDDKWQGKDVKLLAVKGIVLPLWGNSIDSKRKADLWKYYFDLEHGICLGCVYEPAMSPRKTRDTYEYDEDDNSEWPALKRVTRYSMNSGEWEKVLETIIGQTKVVPRFDEEIFKLSGHGLPEYPAPQYRPNSWIRTTVFYALFCSAVLLAIAALISRSNKGESRRK